MRYVALTPSSISRDPGRFSPALSDSEVPHFQARRCRIFSAITGLNVRHLLAGGRGNPRGSGRQARTVVEGGEVKVC